MHQEYAHQRGAKTWSAALVIDVSVVVLPYSCGNVSGMGKPARRESMERRTCNWRICSGIDVFLRQKLRR